VAKPKKSATTTQTGANQRTIVLIGAVVLAVVAIIVIGMRREAGAGATQPVAMEMDPADIQRARGVDMGSADAPVQLHEYADYQCPACQQFSTFIHPLIKERLIDTGLVRLVRYDFPLINNHPHAFLAARAARCAGDQGRYWEYHDVLYGRQPTWSPTRNPADLFVEYAGLVGIDAGTFQRCLASDQHAEEVTRNLRLGESLGVNGTPSFIINGQRASFGSYQELEERVYQMAGRTAPDAPVEAGS
jgi:protein-disulfide isomerase